MSTSDWIRVRQIFGSAILAGICIGLGGIAYLSVGCLEGAVLFAFGLATILKYGFWLYTGKANDVCSLRDVAILFLVVLVGNVMGCGISSLFSSADIVDSAREVVASHIDRGAACNFLYAVPCGIIMTAAVGCYRRGSVIPMLLGVPVFIMCGYVHSVADAFYYITAREFTLEALECWAVAVAGNFIGCNLFRMIHTVL